MKKEEIVNYFEKCKKNAVKEYEIPSEMKNGHLRKSWKLMESSVTEQDIKDLEKEFDLKFSEEYKNYLMAASHMFVNLTGNFDNFCFENDVDISLKIVPQPYKEELEYIKALFINNKILVKEGYIPLGEFDENGYLCIDSKNNDDIVWIPFENCVGFTSREEFEQEQLHIFCHFSDYIKCFFGKETHIVEDI